MEILKNFQTALRNAGLSDEEITFYLAVLKNPGKTVLSLAEKTKISKSTAYRVWRSLEGKNLVSLGEKGVFANSLEKFIESVEAKERKLFRVSESLKEVKKVLPVFSKTMSEGDSLCTFRGDDIFENYFDLLRDSNWGTFFAFGDLRSFIQTVGAQNEEQWISTRVKKGKRAKGVFMSNDAFTRDIISTSPHQLRKAYIHPNKTMPEKYINVFPEVAITMLCSKDELGAKLTIIKNKDLADSQTMLFERFWEECGA